MNNDINQMQGTTKYFGVKINGQIKGKFITESQAGAQAQLLCNEGDTYTIVPVTENGSELLFG